MLDGHGSAMSKMAKQTRSRKQNRNSIFNQDKNELSRGFGKEFIAKTSSPEQKRALANKVKKLAEAERSRFLFFSGLLFITLMVIII